MTIVLSAEAALPSEFGSAQHEAAVEQAWTRHQQRIQQLLAKVNHTKFPLRSVILYSPDWRLLLISLSLLAHRTGQPATYRAGRHSAELKTIIAGYPWFADWGRDSMISVPGLLICTGRYQEARDLLKAFASYTHGGLIPNRFPDSGEAPEYNTIDATLWMFHAIDRYVKATEDWSLLDELFLTLSDYY